MKEGWLKILKPVTLEITELGLCRRAVSVDMKLCSMKPCSFDPGVDGYRSET